MAFLQKMHCFTCGEQTDFINGKCTKCGARERRAQLDAWKAMSTEDKLLDLHQRVSSLERGPAVF